MNLASAESAPPSKLGEGDRNQKLDSYFSNDANWAVLSVSIRAGDSTNSRQAINVECSACRVGNQSRIGAETMDSLRAVQVRPMPSHVDMVILSGIAYFGLSDLGLAIFVRQFQASDMPRECYFAFLRCRAPWLRFGASWRPGAYWGAASYVSVPE